MEPLFSFNFKHMHKALSVCFVISRHLGLVLMSDKSYASLPISATAHIFAWSEVLIKIHSDLYILIGVSFSFFPSPVESDIRCCKFSHS